MSKSLDGVELLLVEDDVDAREIAEEFFSSEGAVLRTAGSLEEGLAVLQEWAPSLVITDISLPDGDGYMFLARARALRPGVPAIAVTGYASPEDRDRARAAGFQDHVSKPIDLDDLLAVVIRLATPKG